MVDPSACARGVFAKPFFLPKYFLTCCENESGTELETKTRSFWIQRPTIVLWKYWGDGVVVYGKFLAILTFMAIPLPFSPECQTQTQV